MPKHVLFQIAIPVHLQALYLKVSELLLCKLITGLRGYTRTCVHNNIRKSSIAPTVAKEGCRGLKRMYRSGQETTKEEERKTEEEEGRRMKEGEQTTEEIKRNNKKAMEYKKEGQKMEY